MSVINYKEPARLTMMNFRKFVDTMDTKQEETPKPKKGLLAPTKNPMMSMEEKSNSPAMRAAQYAKQIRDIMRNGNGIS